MVKGMMDINRDFLLGEKPKSSLPSPFVCSRLSRSVWALTLLGTGIDLLEN
jgi:hypothetical protein